MVNFVISQNYECGVKIARRCELLDKVYVLSGTVQPRQVNLYR